MFAQGLSDEQLLRWQRQRIDDPFMHNLFPMLLVLVDTVLQPKTVPRLPSPHPPTDLHQRRASQRLARKRARSRSPGACQHAHSRQSPAEQHAAGPHFTSGRHSEHFRHMFPPQRVQQIFPPVSPQQALQAQVWLAGAVPHINVSAIQEPRATLAQSAGLDSGHAEPVPAEASIEALPGSQGPSQIPAELGPAAHEHPPLTDVFAELEAIFADLAPLSHGSIAEVCPDYLVAQDSARDFGVPSVCPHMPSSQ